MIYQLSSNENTVCMIDLNGTVSWIPNDPANTDWQNYQQWLADGNEPLPAPEDEEE